MEFAEKQDFGPQFLQSGCIGKTNVETIIQSKRKELTERDDKNSLLKISKNWICSDAKGRTRFIGNCTSLITRLDSECQSIVDLPAIAKVAVSQIIRTLCHALDTMRRTNDTCHLLSPEATMLTVRSCGQMLLEGLTRIMRDLISDIDGLLHRALTPCLSRVVRHLIDILDNFGCTSSIPSEIKLQLHRRKALLKQSDSQASPQLPAQIVASRIPESPQHRKLSSHPSAKTTVVGVRSHQQEEDEAYPNQEIPLREILLEDEAALTFLQRVLYSLILFEAEIVQHTGGRTISESIRDIEELEAKFPWSSPLLNETISASYFVDEAIPPPPRSSSSSAAAILVAGRQEGTSAHPPQS